MLRRARAVEGRIRELGWQGQPVAFAFGRDVGAFAAALLGCWRAGCHALLPADARRELVGPLLGADHGGPLIHDTGVGRGIHAPSLGLAFAAAEGAAGSNGSFEIPLPVGPAVSTVGYSGLDAHGGSVWRDADVRPPWLQPGLAPLAGRTWTGVEVLAEVAHWRAEVAEAAAVGTTLSPMAQPAVFLAVLAPLAAGVPILEVVGDPRVPAATETLWITSPAHRRLLGRGPCMVTMAWGGEVAERCSMLPEPTAASEDRSAVAARCAALAGVLDVGVVPAGDGGWRVAVVVEEGAVCDAPSGVAEVVEAQVVDDLGRDPNGLLPDRVVYRLLGRDADGRPFERGWTVTELVREGEGVAFAVDVPPRSAWYEGHFPGYPVLAGAVQLQELIEPLIERSGAAVGRWQGLKFPARIEPGDRLDVRLRGDRAVGKVSFEVRRDETLCTAGVAVLQAEAGNG